MDVTKNTDSKLVVWDRKIISTLLVGAMASTAVLGSTINPDGFGLLQRLLVLALGIGLLWIIWAKMPFQRFVFDRASGRIVRTRWHLWHRVQDSMPIADIAGIRQQADLVGNRGTTHYLVVDYEADDGKVRSERLSESSTGKRHDKSLETINEWLTRPA